MNSPITKNKSVEYHLCPLDELYNHLDTTQQGLTSENVAQRLEEVGTNELHVKQDVPEIVKFLRQFKNFFALLLIAGSALALFAEQLDPGVGNLYIAIWRHCSKRNLYLYSGTSKRKDNGKFS